MKTFLCRVAELTPGLLDRARMGEWLGILGGRAFQHGSSYDQAPPDFTVDFQFAEVWPIDGLEAQVYWLHQALAQLVGTDPDHALGVDSIGLLLAPSLWQQPGVLGMMFDSPVAHPASAEPPYSNAPRQGCAIFLDAIARLRPDPESFFRELQFTTVHELGHVFNLWHLQSPPSFMALSPPTQAFPDPYFTFVGDDTFPATANQRSFLAQCSQAPTVHPGGTDFGHRFPQGPNGVDPAGVANAIRLPAPLRLQISLTTDEFWPFEPVELDLAATPAGNRNRPVLANNVFDPGYDCFKIWIEDAQGWRRHYQSPVRFCQNYQFKTLDATDPFRRDISVFRQSTGLTFAHPGDYTIWVELKASRRAATVSNKIRLSILPPRPDLPSYRRKSRLLSKPAVQRQLYYRHGRMTRTEVETLKTAADLYGRSPLGGVLQYALVSSVVRKLQAARRRPTRSEQRLLKSSVDGAAQALPANGHLRTKIARRIEEMNNL